MQKLEETNPNGSHGAKHTQKQEETNPSGPRGHPTTTRKQTYTVPGGPKLRKSLKKQTQTDPEGPKTRKTRRKQTQTDSEGLKARNYKRKQSQTDPKASNKSTQVDAKQKRDHDGPQTCKNKSKALESLYSRSNQRAKFVETQTSDSLRKLRSLGGGHGHPDGRVAAPAASPAAHRAAAWTT